MSVIEVIRLDSVGVSPAHRVNAVKALNFYRMLNPATGPGLSCAFRTFECLVAYRQIMKLLPP